MKLLSQESKYIASHSSKLNIKLEQELNTIETQLKILGPELDIKEEADDIIKRRTSLLQDKIELEKI